MKRLTSVMVLLAVGALLTGCHAATPDQVRFVSGVFLKCFLLLNLLANSANI